MIPFPPSSLRILFYYFFLLSFNLQRVKNVPLCQSEPCIRSDIPPTPNTVLYFYSPQILIYLIICIASYRKYQGGIRMVQKWVRNRWIFFFFKHALKWAVTRKNLTVGIRVFLAQNTPVHISLTYFFQLILRFDTPTFLQNSYFYSVFGSKVLFEFNISTLIPINLISWIILAKIPNY